MNKILTSILLILICLIPRSSSAEVKPIVEGNIEAKIKIIVYESLTCRFCGDFHKKAAP